MVKATESYWLKWLFDEVYWSWEAEVVMNGHVVNSEELWSLHYCILNFQASGTTELSCIVKQPWMGLKMPYVQFIEHFIHKLITTNYPNTFINNALVQ
jgi:hypothetical protein